MKGSTPDPSGARPSPLRSSGSCPTSQCLHSRGSAAPVSRWEPDRRWVRWGPPSDRCPPSRYLLPSLPAHSISDRWRWWFLREGENHFDEWLSIKLPVRWLTAAASTLFLALIVGAAAGVLAAALAWLARGSAGIGRLTDIGPDPLWTAVWLTAEVGIGVVIGYAAGPWLERRQLRDAEMGTAPNSK